MEIVKIIGIYADFINIIPILAFLISKSVNKFPYLFYQLVIVQVISMVGYILGINDIFNLYLYHLIGLVELIFFYGFYKSGKSKIPKAFQFAFYIIVVLYLLNSFFLEGFLTTINSYGRSLSSAFIVALGLNYLYQLYKNENEMDIVDNPVFFFNAALIIYFATSFITFIFSKKILSQEFNTWFAAGWTLHILADFIKNIIIAFTIILLNKKIKKTVI